MRVHAGVGFRVNNADNDGLCGCIAEVEIIEDRGDFINSIRVWLYLYSIGQILADRDDIFSCLVCFMDDLHTDAEYRFGLCSHRNIDRKGKVCGKSKSAGFRHDLNRLFGIFTLYDSTE